MDLAIAKRRIHHITTRGEDATEVTDGDASRTIVEARYDLLAVEAPLELRSRGNAILVVMRTPGHDRELARGLLFCEGFITATNALEDMAPPADNHTLSADERGNVLDIGHDVQPVNRTLPVSASCGVCGKRAIAELALRARPLRTSFAVSADIVAALPTQLRRAQHVFDQTGGLHAAGAFTKTGQLLAIREDIGRHNAVDKLVGWALERDLVPMHEAILCVSGRLSFEIVQKAIMAGFPMIAAVSAPSSLAVDLAERFRVTLCGFVRGGSLNSYTHASRIT